MDRSKRDLEALVNTQKEQLIRYEKRLKDVVTAYKGLLKEKEALETSLAAVTANKDGRRDSSANSNDDKEASAQVDVSGSNSSLSNPAVTNDNVDVESSHLQTQIITLMNSLATLSAEKSRMEASFQADKKQLRTQLAQKDQTISELLEKIRERDDRAKLEVEEVKAKWILERQEREKETNNQMIMIRELQKLYADERHLKDNIEMQLNNFKTQFANNEAENTRFNDLQNQLREAKSQLKQLEVKHRSLNGDEIASNVTVIKQVQLEMQQLKEQHAVAIKNEQRRVLHAEEESRKQAALHEDRVANLESRLAELSSTVGSYDRLRQQDQEAIQVLKKKLQELEYHTDNATNESIDGSHGSLLQQKKIQNITSYDLSAIIDEIMRLKKLVMRENARSTNPIDISHIFSVGTDHTQCKEEINTLQHQYDECKHEASKLQDKIEVQKSHISTLQEKVKVLNQNIDEQEIELKIQGEKLSQAVKEERTKWKETMTDLENDCRSKVNNLEQQLQKQRQRSLQLLDEKEQEIKTLQTSFEIFQNAALPVNTSTATMHSNRSVFNNDAAHTGASSDADSTEGIATTTNIKVKSKKLSIGENCHMLHYANEIARKDIEIAGLRKAKYAAETSLRKAIHDKVTAQEDLCDKIDTLEEEVDRLERCKTREGANLEYLKNVIISFIVTKDTDGKRHMMNAISAVLQFTPIEIQTINAAFQKK